MKMSSYLQVIVEPTTKTDKKLERHAEIIRLWEETTLNKTQIAKAVGMKSMADVGHIIKRNAAYRDVKKQETPSDENPCRVKIKTLPVCYGVGCYHAGPLCPAFVAHQARTSSSG